MTRKLNWYLIMGGSLVFLLFFIAIFAPLLVPLREYTEEEKARILPYYKPNSNKLTVSSEVIDGKRVYLNPPVKPFELEGYPLGTDKHGYDLLTTVVYGAKYTLFIALAVSLFRVLLGTIIGLYMGMKSKTPPWWLSIENTWAYIPIFIPVYLLLLPVNSGYNKIPDVKVLDLVIYFVIIATFFGMPSIVTTIREKTQQVKELPFILASKSLGAGKIRLMFKHIFPQLKEYFLLILIAEIIAVITLMGHLGMFNIFIGGTAMYNGPALWMSMSEEWAGLVGQARSNIYHLQYVLFIPLTCVLLAITAFSLLLKGFEKHFLFTYRRRPYLPLRTNTKKIS